MVAFTVVVDTITTRMLHLEPFQSVTGSEKPQYHACEPLESVPGLGLGYRS